NSLPRWLISITDMPLPCQSSISAAALRSTASGSTAGPALKLNTRIENSGKNQRGRARIVTCGERDAPFGRAAGGPADEARRRSAIAGLEVIGDKPRAIAAPYGDSCAVQAKGQPGEIILDELALRAIRCAAEIAGSIDRWPRLSDAPGHGLPA